MARIGTIVAFALVLPAGMGWRGWGWRGLAALLLGFAALVAAAAVALHREDQECLATPGCESWSGIVWTLLLGASVGYPVVAAALVGFGAWARRRWAAGAARDAGTTVPRRESE